MTGRRGAVDHLVLNLRVVAFAAIAPAGRAGVGCEATGQAHARVEEAGVLIRQAARCPCS